MLKKFSPGDIFTNVIRAYPKVEFFLNSGSVNSVYYNRNIETTPSQQDGYIYLNNLIKYVSPVTGPIELTYFSYSNLTFEAGDNVNITASNPTNWEGFILSGTYPSNVGINSSNGTITGSIVEDDLSGSTYNVTVYATSSLNAEIASASFTLDAYQVYQVSVYNSGSALTDYELLVEDSNFAGKDMEFYSDVNRQNALPWWRESTAGKYWTQLDISASNVELFYAAWGTNIDGGDGIGENVFYFFDGFTGSGGVDDGRWINIATGSFNGIFTSSNGTGTMSGYSGSQGGYAYAEISASLNDATIMESRFQIPDLPDTRNRNRFRMISNKDVGFFSNVVSSPYQVEVFDGAFQGVYLDRNQYYRLYQHITGTSFNFKVEEEDGTSLYDATSTGAKNSRVFINPGDNASVINGGHIAMDWIFLRQYVTNTFTISSSVVADSDLTGNFAYQDTEYAVSSTPIILPQTSSGWSNFALEGTYPAGLNINSNNGIIYGSFSSSDLLTGSGASLGVHTISVSAEDQLGSPLTSSFQLTVIGDALPSAIVYISMDSGSISGSNITDLAGGYDGTINGSPSSVAGIDGQQALSFTASDYIDLTNSSAYKTTSGSWSVWVKTTQSGVHQPISLHDAASNAANGAYFYNSAGSLGVDIRNSSTSVYIQGSTGSLNDGNWHLLTMVYEKSGVSSLYADGVLQGSATAGTWNWTSNPLRIAGERSTWSGITQYVGSLDDFVVFSGKLTQNQVSTLMWLKEKGTTLTEWLGL